MSYIPTYDSLDAIYDKSFVAKQGARYQALLDKFEQTYHRKPDFIARSPGRVNLIGEHIDYCGFGVLPMAVDRDVVMAVATTNDDTKVRVANVNSKYPAREFDYEGVEKIVTIDDSSLEWSNYFKCGYKGMLERAQLQKPKGMFVLVDGNVPAGSGLSSSAAFCCTSALTVITANELKMTKQELTEIAIVAERNVGVNSGGMDQSASVLSEQGFALHVEFVPKLKAVPVKLPETQPKLAFVIANTLVTADKFVTGPRNYNLRVVETKVGALCLSRALKLAKPVDTYKEVCDAYFAGQNISQDEQLKKMLSVADQVFTNTTGYTRSEMAELSGVAEDELVKEYMTRFPVETDVFRLHQRAIHVFGEALRVIQFGNVCANPPSDSDQVYKQLGGLMNQSQESCSKLFNCSCPELDELTALAREAGAEGSRLTGAGWGGCTVSLVREDQVPEFIATIKEKYYKKHFPELTGDELDDAILATKPCSGSAVFSGF
ncbi:galactokinase [Umbelopsis sp. AD052]|nr:galactokinase [Umbelopsis sp. AD052]